MILLQLPPFSHLLCLIPFRITATQHIKSLFLKIFCIYRPIIPSTDDSRHLVVNMDARACHGSEFEVAYLEHVILRISLTHPHRGDLNILLTSPSGTVSNILDRRLVGLYIEMIFFVMADTVL